MSVLSSWLLNHASGRDLLQREEAVLEAWSREIFGQIAVQMGDFPVDMLRAVHCVRKLHIGMHDTAQVRCHLDQLPFQNNTLDGIVIAHQLEYHTCSHALLKAACRALRPEGKIVIISFNPLSLWQFSKKWNNVLPRRSACYFPSYWRDVLHDEQCPVIAGKFMGYTPLVDSDQFLKKLNFINKIGNRWVPHCAVSYALMAVKRTPSMRLRQTQWASSLPDASWAAASRQCVE